MKKMNRLNRWLAVFLAVCTMLSVTAFAQDTDAEPLCAEPACELPEVEVPDYVWPDCELPDVDFDLCDCEVTHIDVKVDSTYFVVIDGALVPIHGMLDPDTIKIVVKTPVTDIVYDFSEYDVETVNERGMWEYRINLKVPDASLLAAIRWAGWHMRNVYFSADIILDNVPDALKDSLEKNAYGKYYASLEDILYTGIQECTGGHGMRSFGNVGIPTGLDLYLCGADLTPHFATGGFTIKKVLKDSDGKVIRPGSDAPFFTFTVKDWMGNPVYFDADGVCTIASQGSAQIRIQAGKSFKLTGLLKGCYVVEEVETDDDYELTSVKVGKTESCTGEVLVGTDSVITFTNTKKGTTDPVDPVDPPKPDTETGKLTIKKVLVDDKGEEVQVDAESAPEFTFTVEGKNFYKTVKVKAGQSEKLTLNQGTYTVTEAETDGYKLYSVNDQTDITSAQVRVGDEETTVTFANVKKDSTGPGKPTDPEKPTDPSNPGTNPSNPGTNPSNPGTNPSDPGTNPSNPGGGSSETTPTPTGDDAPKTGDRGSMALMMLMPPSVLGMGAAVVIGRKFRYTGKRCK